MNTTNSPDPDVPSPRVVLDEEKRQLILALVTNGSSRRAAARYVGCSPSAITRLVARDPEFAGRMAAARQKTQVECLRAIRNAACERHQWRAAAWLLEHKYPGDFSSQRPHTYTSAQLLALLQRAADEVASWVPAGHQRFVSRWIEEVTQLVRRKIAPGCETESQHSVDTVLGRPSFGVDGSNEENDDCDDEP